MVRAKWILIGILLLLISADALAQQPTAKPEMSYKYRTIFTIAGAGGGFTLGVFAGLAKFDDAVNSDRKVWTTAILGGAGGAVGGYFLGRVLDKRRDRADLRLQQRTVQVSPLLSTDTKGLHVSISF
jgi:hypothetical protein